MDNRGLVQMDTITVPSLASFMDKVGKVESACEGLGQYGAGLPMPMKKNGLKGHLDIPGHVLASFPSHVLGVGSFGFSR